jgi:hypothetical protein
VISEKEKSRSISQSKSGVSLSVVLIPPNKNSFEEIKRLNELH